MSLSRGERGEAGGGSTTSTASHPEPLNPLSLPRVTPAAWDLCPKREWQLWSQGLQHPRLTKAALFEPLPGQQLWPRAQLPLCKVSQSEPRPASEPAHIQLCIAGLSSLKYYFFRFQDSCFNNLGADVEQNTFLLLDNQEQVEFIFWYMMYIRRPTYDICFIYLIFLKHAPCGLLVPPFHM